MQQNSAEKNKRKTRIAKGVEQPGKVNINNLSGLGIGLGTIQDDGEFETVSSNHKGLRSVVSDFDSVSASETAAVKEAMAAMTQTEARIADNFEKKKTSTKGKKKNNKRKAVVQNKTMHAENDGNEDAEEAAFWAKVRAGKCKDNNSKSKNNADLMAISSKPPSGNKNKKLKKNKKGKEQNRPDKKYRK